MGAATADERKTEEGCVGCWKKMFVPTTYEGKLEENRANGMFEMVEIIEKCLFLRRGWDGEKGKEKNGFSYGRVRRN